MAIESYMLPPPLSQDPPQAFIPEAEMEIDFVRSSGPGGQKVNKTSSKAQLRWNVDRSAVFTPEEKARIKTQLVNRLNKAGEIVLASDEMRSQPQNRERVVELLRTLVARALVPEKERIPTHPRRAAKERRLDDKARQGQKKQTRGKSWEE